MAIYLDDKKFVKQLLEGNERAFAAGLSWAREHPLCEARILAPSKGLGQDKITVDGNEICAAGALFAGCDFFGGYPITPSSPMGEFADQPVNPLPTHPLRL